MSEEKIQQTLDIICLELARLGEGQRGMSGRQDAMALQLETLDAEVRKTGGLLEDLNHKVDLSIELNQIQYNNLAKRVDTLEKKVCTY